MNLIRDFYTNLDLLELIIFWGIVLVIILSIILIIIIINKKQKKSTDKTFSDYTEELPIIKEQPVKEENNINDIDTSNETVFSIHNENTLLEEMEPIIEMVEENIEKPESTEETETNKYKTTFEIPSAPYQKNVLREMSLSQTSPIGINRKDDYTKQQELFNIYNKNEEMIDLNNQIEKVEETQKETEENIHKETTDKSIIYNNDLFEEQNIIEEPKEDNFDIERTKYEIEQEENAIISYKELMEKKDSIQTIDEEDAVISIEELLNKTNKKEEPKEDIKLYNISETEENDSFINELKQFRKDL